MAQAKMLGNIPWNTIFIGAIVFVIFWMFIRKKHHGPWGFPYFGILHMLRGQVHLSLTEMAQKQYGDVFFFKITGQLYVHLATVEAIRELHVTKADCFPHRAQSNFIFDVGLGGGLVREKGDTWKVHRKFIVQILRELTNKEALGSALDLAVSDVLHKLRETKGAPVTFMEIFHDPFVEAARGIVVGDSNKHFVHDILHAYIQMNEQMTPEKFLIAGSLARWFALRFTSFKDINANREKMESLLVKVIRLRESPVSAGDVENTLIDRYLQERNLRREKKDPQTEYFDTDSLAKTLVQLFGDLCTTVTPFISSLMGGLSLKPDVQERMREEMLRELGEDLDRTPSMDDKVRLPYVNAVLKELIRCTPFFPIYPSVQCFSETTVCGFRIPVGCTAVVNSWAANHDLKIYDEPNKFKPERFLSSNARKVEQPTMFGIGRRSCIGESLSTMALFLFVAAVIRNFIIKPEGDISNMRSLNLSMKMKLCATPVDSSKSKESLK